jgi:hypothetical protein
MVVGSETSGSIATPSQANGSAHERKGTQLNSKDRTLRL